MLLICDGATKENANLQKKSAKLEAGTWYLTCSEHHVMFEGRMQSAVTLNRSDSKCNAKSAKVAQNGEHFSHWVFALPPCYHGQ